MMAPEAPKAGDIAPKIFSGGTEFPAQYALPYMFASEILHR